MVPLDRYAKTFNVLFCILKAIILNRYYYPYFERNIQKSDVIAQNLSATKY